MSLMVIVGIFILLFAVAFVSKRRFGTLGLALASGALLASQASKNVSEIFVAFDIPTGSMTTTAAAAITLTLLPAIILLFSGPSYTLRYQVVIGSLLFAAMALLLLLGPISTVLDLGGTSHTILTIVSQNANAFLAGFILLATVDAWLTHNLKSPQPLKK